MFTMKTIFFRVHIYCTVYEDQSENLVKKITVLLNLLEKSNKTFLNHIAMWKSTTVPLRCVSLYTFYAQQVW